MLGSARLHRHDRFKNCADLRRPDTAIGEPTNLKTKCINDLDNAGRTLDMKRCGPVDIVTG